MNQLLIHGVVSVELEPIKHHELDNGHRYTCRDLIIQSTDFAGNMQRTTISLFSEAAEQITVIDPQAVETC